MNFLKMHAQGNDYVYFDRREAGLPALKLASLARAVSCRHTGVGGDGMVMLLPADEEGVDAAFRMWNADGSEAEICGSALRCVTDYLCRELDVRAVNLRTVAGLRRGELTDNGVRVDMDVPSTPQPMHTSFGEGWLVRVGNPHLVLPVPELRQADIERMGPRLERSVPGGVNVHLMRMQGAALEMFTWERGSGLTLACGSGACAAARVARELAPAAALFTVRQPGGKVRVIPDEQGHYWLEGPVSRVCSGRLCEDFLATLTRP